MIHDLSNGNVPQQLPAVDVAIVGSGPAGATLAIELARTGLSVAVLESGTRRVSARGDRLREVRSRGIGIKAWSRERVLGGASTTWAGLAAPLDDIDFEDRPQYEVPAWPISRAALEPAWAAAAERYGFAAPSTFAGEPPADGGPSFPEIKTRGDLQPELDRIDEKVFLAAQPAQNFAKLAADAYAGEAIQVYLDATVVEIDLQDGAARALHLRSTDGTTRTLDARAVVLATGGIENARQLLLAAERGAEGLGGPMLGRCFMNHPKNYRGILHLQAPVRELPYYFGCLASGFAGYAGLRLPEQEQRERGLLNSYVRLEPLFAWSDNQGVESLVLLAKKSKVAVAAMTPRKRGKLTSLRDYSETGDDSELQNKRRDAMGWLGAFGTVLRHAPSVAQYLWFRVVPGQVPRVRRARLRNFMEMEPHPDNRVTLSDERDEHGLPLPHVEHRCTALDRLSLVALHERLAESFAAAGIGRLESDLAECGHDDWPIDQDASHHVGTTRMGLDPATSVVDADLRVHGTDNLYCAGGSVFPTSGCANPTFTICALSIRLAEHLTARLADPAAGPDSTAR